MRQFDEAMFVGKEVIHAKFGKGKIISADQSCVSVSFEIGVKDLSIEVAFADGKNMKLTDAVSQSLVEEIISENKAKKQEEARMKKEAAESKRKAEVAEEIAKNKAKRSKTGKTAWIKFEGEQDRNRMANVHVVMQNGKPWYVLHYSKRPSGVKDGDTFYLAEGIIDDSGKRKQVITARGKLLGFSDENFSPKEWEKTFPWLSWHPWYVVIAECEVLDAEIRKGLKLEHVINELGTETYLSTSGMNRDHDYLMKVHCQKQSMKLTEEAETFINKEFNKLVEKYGSKHYKTIL